MGGQGRPTPVCTPMPQTYAKSIQKRSLPTLTHAHGPTDQSTNGWTDKQTKSLTELQSAPKKANHAFGQEQ